MRIPLPVGDLPSPDLLRSLAPELAVAAGKVYHEWAQVDGWDEELGEGGICDRIADAMAGVLGDNGFDNVLTMPAQVGENHVFVMALAEDGAWMVDIPPWHYEAGSAFTWRKRDDVTFDSGCVTLDKLEGPMSPAEFDERYRDC